MSPSVVMIRFAQQVLCYLKVTFVGEVCPGMLCMSKKVMSSCFRCIRHWHSVLKLSLMISRVRMPILEFILTLRVAGTKAGYYRVPRREGQRDCPRNHWFTLAKWHHYITKAVVFEQAECAFLSLRD